MSANTVTNWEGKPGMLKLRQPARDALLALRGIGIREARQRLEAWGQSCCSVRDPSTGGGNESDGRGMGVSFLS